MLGPLEGVAYAVGECAVRVCEQSGGEGVERPGDRVLVLRFAVGLADVDLADEAVRSSGDEVDEFVWRAQGGPALMCGVRRCGTHDAHFTTYRGNVHIAW